MSFITPTLGDVFITFLFIALDGDYLGDGIQSLDFLHDYGNNKINHFLSSKRRTTKFYEESTDDSDSDRDGDEEPQQQLTEEQIILKQFIPIGVLKYLSS